MNETVQPSRAVIDPKLMPDTFALILAAAKRLGYAERLSIEVIREMANAVVHEWVHTVERHQLKNMETIAELEREVERLRADKERIDWMESQGFGAGLIHDDEGHWIWANEGGFQGIRSTAPDDPWSSMLIVDDHSKFRERIRDAIDVGRADAERSAALASLDEEPKS